jgi:hypothetical protein
MPLDLSGTFVEGKNKKPWVPEPKFLSPTEKALLTTKHEIPTLRYGFASCVLLDRKSEEAIESYVLWEPWNEWIPSRR